MIKTDAPFAIGDRVTTEFIHEHSDVVRTVTEVEAYNPIVNLGPPSSGWIIAADAGEPCPTCGKAPSQEIPVIDSGWFQKVEEDAS